MRPPFSFDPTALLSPVGRVPCRGSQEAGAQARPAARDTSGFDDEAQHGSGSVNRGRGADVDENAEGDSRRQGVHSGKTRRFLMTNLDAAGLEARLKIVEDKLAIYELIASHPPSADTGSLTTPLRFISRMECSIEDLHPTARLESKILPLSLSDRHTSRPFAMGSLILPACL